MLLPDIEIQQLMLQSGLVDTKTMRDVLVFAANARVPLQQALMEKDVIPDEKLGELIAAHIKYPFVNLQNITIPEGVYRIIPERLARKHKAIVFGKDGESVKLAAADPVNTKLAEVVQKKTGQKVTVYMATEKDIDNVLQLYRKDLQQTFDQMLQAEITRTATSMDDAPIAKIVDLLITYAYRDKASDVHIEPEEKNSLVRFRIDGILHDVLYVDKKLHDRITTRIKVLSRLRTDEHLSAQDGKMRIEVDEENLDIRVSMIPVTEGEKVVMRLLSSKFRQFSLQDLGMNEEDLTKVTNAINKSYGMILSTGPTGSGKTTSVYAILKIVNTREKNITTIEEPVEYRIKGVNQIQVNPKTNLTFANGLRSILRQDPNVIFVGEIRDSETAGIAVNAALTGHLVLSTVHTNDAATTLPRLIDMKIEPFLVASTVNVIIAQRLVRKICDSCKSPIVLSRKDALKDIPDDVISKHFGPQDQIRVYEGKGCRICHATGYTGRIGIFEVIDMSEKIRELITKKSDSDEIARQAIEEGMTTMLDDGMQKVGKGMTTIKEVLRVTKVESG